MELTELLDELTAQKGSDLHLTVGLPPIFRVAGQLLRREGNALDAEAMGYLLQPHLTPTEGERLAALRDVEKTLRHKGLRFRVNIYREKGNLAACVRVGPSRVHTLDELGMGAEALPALAQLLQLPRGLIVVTGPTGSGKTTSTAAMIEEINLQRAERILTIEEPIEYEFQSKKSIITQRAVGEDVAEFPAALRSAFGEDPDVIWVGETRDLETMSLTLSLAETGHLVFSTLHVNTTSAAVQRLVDVFPDGQRSVIRRMLSQCLAGVIAQRLVPRRERPGRVAVNEILIATSRIRQMIQEGQTDFNVALEAGRDIGMQTMDDAFVNLYKKGEIAFDTAWFHLEDKSRLTPPG